MLATALALAFALAPWATFARVSRAGIRARTVDVEHYRLALRFDDRAGEVSGSAFITFRPLADGLGELTLDAAGLRVARVTLEATGAALPFALDEASETLRVGLGRAHAREERLTVEVAYSARPTRGLYFFPADASEPERPAQFWSQGQAADNHYWFPCWDAPDDKATATVEMTVDGRFTTVSNGELVSGRANADGTRTFVWEQRLPHSSYLISVVGGEFRTVTGAWRDVPLAYVVPPGLAERVDRSLGQTPAMMQAFVDRLGHDYPWAKYSQTVVANFPHGGMENTSATTLAESVLLDARAAVDSSADDLVAHELAHQWFGNLVTCRDWSQAWLNEGFATYFSAVWTEQAKGRDDYLYAMRREAVERELVAGTTKRPLVVDDFDNPDEIFLGSTVYSKGAWVVHMLRKHLGEALFWRGMTHYLSKHAFGVVTTDDLRVALEESSGQQLGWFFDQWVFRPGHPEFEVTTVWDAAASTLRLTLAQRQGLADGTPIFRGAVPVVIVTARGRRVERVWFDAAEASFSFPLDGPPLMVSFDPEADMLRTVRHEKSTSELAYQLANDAVPGRIWAAERLGASRDPRAVAALGSALAKDGFHGVREIAALQLWKAGTDASRAALRTAARDPHPRVRVAAASALGDGSRASRNLLKALVRSDASDAVAVAAIGALVGRRDASAFDLLASVLESRTRGTPAREAALRGMRLLRVPRALPLALAWARPGRPPALRVAALEVIGALGRGDARAGALAVEALADVRPAIRAAAADAAGQTLADAARPALESALDRERDESVRRAISRALARLARKRAA